jgi:hypothetical protein
MLVKCIVVYGAFGTARLMVDSTRLRERMSVFLGVFMWTVGCRTAACARIVKSAKTVGRDASFMLELAIKCSSSIGAGYNG